MYGLCYGTKRSAAWCLSGKSETGTFRKQRLRVDDAGKQFVHQISPSVRLSVLLSDDRQRWQLRARGAR